VTGQSALKGFDPLILKVTVVLWAYIFCKSLFILDSTCTRQYHMKMKREEQHSSMKTEQTAAVIERFLIVSRGNEQSHLISVTRPRRPVHAHTFGGEMEWNAWPDPGLLSVRYQQAGRIRTEFCSLLQISRFADHYPVKCVAQAWHQ
jgi:hypothetical protein